MTDKAPEPEDYRDYEDDTAYDFENPIELDAVDPEGRHDAHDLEVTEEEAAEGNRLSQELGSDDGED